MPANDGHTACRSFVDRLGSYADGDLTERENQEFRLHLETCPRCRSAYESHEKMILLLESTREKDPPWDLDFKVLQAVGFGGVRTQLRGYRVSPPLVWAATVVGLIGLGFGGWVLGRGVVKIASAIFGPSGSLSAGDMAALASKLTRYLVTVWDSVLAGLRTLEALVRSLGAVSNAAKDNPAVIGAALGTLALVLLFFRLMTRERSSRVRNVHDKRIRGSSRR
jgi:anti-sigma factor RsiW